MNTKNPQWWRLQKESDMDILLASVAVEKVLMTVAENALLVDAGLATQKIQDMQTPDDLNKYLARRNFLIVSEKVNERRLIREALGLLRG